MLMSPKGVAIMKVPIIHWTNGLGEKCESPAYATFHNDDGERCYVVKSWRSGYAIFPDSEIDSLEIRDIEP
jgi:hypothetical protein